MVVSWYLFHTHTYTVGHKSEAHSVVCSSFLFPFFLFPFPHFFLPFIYLLFSFPPIFLLSSTSFPFFSFCFSIFSFLPVFYLVYIYTTLRYTWVWPKYSSTFLGGRTLEELLLCQYDLFMFARLHLDFYIAVCHFKILNV